MKNIHAQRVRYKTEEDYVDYAKGANIAGFVKALCDDGVWYFVEIDFNQFYAKVGEFSMSTIVGIAGSLRNGSFNATLLRAATENASDGYTMNGLV
jgi:hypothetical protein